MVLIEQGKEFRPPLPSGSSKTKRSLRVASGCRRKCYNAQSNLYIPSKSIFLGLNSYNTQSGMSLNATKLNFHAIKLNVHATKLNVHATKLNFHATKLNFHATKLNVHATKLKFHAKTN